ncbi:MAG: HDOD domain-containing protein [Planctomycetota bacterium]
MSIRILFVDDETQLLDGLRRMLRPMRKEWEMVFSRESREALALVEEKPFDVVICDMRMPGVDGAELLERVRELHPHTIRIMLSGYADREMILRSVGTTHQFLSKPCEAEQIRRTIERATALGDLLADERVKGVVSRLDSLPGKSNLFEEMVSELKKPTASLDRVGEIISQDAGMTVQILKLVNSAYFGLSQRVASPSMAVKLLGLNTITSLVLTVPVFKGVEPCLLERLGIAGVWRHSMLSGLLAKAIGRSVSEDPGLGDEAFTAGVIHDVGKIVLAINETDALGRAVEAARHQRRKLIETEVAEIGASHAEIGAYLLGLWGLPHSIVEAVAFHHRPSDCVHSSLSPLTCVHVANSLVREEMPAGEGEPPAPLDGDYLERLGLAGRLSEWQRKASSLAASEGAPA